MKNKRKSPYSIILYLRWPLLLSALLVLMNLILLAADSKAGAAMGVFTILFVLVSGVLYFYSRKGLYAGLIDFAHDFKSTETDILKHMGTPAAIISPRGVLLWGNDSFFSIFDTASVRQGIQNVFPDITKDVLEEFGDSCLIHSSYADSRYLIEMQPAEEEFIVITITDETELVRYKKNYEDSRPCIGLIYLDNYDEALASVEDARRSLLTALVDRRISNYISSHKGIAKKLENDKYLFFVEEINAKVMAEKRFSILEDVKTINIGNELALTLSIGLGRTGGSYNENYEYARAAIDLALGRGGDQAVVKSGEAIEYFGGKTLAPEKNVRVKARVMGRAFKELLSSSDKLLVMGHRNGDADSLGAAIGIWKIARSYGKTAHIVLNSVTKSLEPMYRLFRNNPDYPEDMFIGSDKALAIQDPTTLVVVVDVNRPSYTEEPRLLENASAVAVIDHHRRGSESVPRAALSYIEPSASSACEMTAELIQYIDDTTTVTPLEADALYGGIVIDTQNFITQTGIRTFEAAAYLKGKGASVQRIRKLYRDSLSDTRAVAGAVNAAEIYRSSFALSDLDPTGVDSPTVAGAQAANSLLDIDGIRAAFVFTPYNGQIFVSARSIDDVNVQIMMERLGGGGHMTIAGAQLKDVSVPEAREQVKELIDDMIEKGEI